MSKITPEHLTRQAIVCGFVNRDDETPDFAQRRPRKDVSLRPVAL